MDEELKGLLPTLLAKVDRIDTRLDGIDTRLDGIVSRLDGIDSRLDALAAEQKTFKESQLRMEGQMSVLILWLQSVDQRFQALMAPVVPPKKPAA